MAFLDLVFMNFVYQQCAGEEILDDKLMESPACIFVRTFEATIDPLIDRRVTTIPGFLVQAARITQLALKSGYGRRRGTESIDQKKLL